MTLLGRIGAALLVLMALPACSNNDSSPTGPTVIRGSGNVVSQSRTISPVHSVDLRIVGTVNLLPGGTQSLSVRADDNILAAIATRDSSGVLIVEVSPGSAISNYTLAVDLTVPDIESVIMRSAGTIAGSGFVVDALSVVLSGAGTINLDVAADAVSSVLSGTGNIILAGSADAQQIVNSGAGTVRAFGLVSGSTSVVLSGVGAVEVTATTALSAIISGTGSVYYKGSPTISSVITGTGAVIDAN